MRAKTKALHNIRCSAVSSDGGYVAYADVLETKLFRIAKGAEISCEHCETFEQGANALCFSSCATRLVVAPMDGMHARKRTRSHTDTRTHARTHACTVPCAHKRMHAHAHARSCTPACTHACSLA